MPYNLISTDPKLVRKSADVNATTLGRLTNSKTVVKLVGNSDTTKPPAPAWYEPATNDIYIHVDDAGIDINGVSPATLQGEGVYGFSDQMDTSKLVGLFAHETAHSRISKDLDVVQNQAVKDGVPMPIINCMTMLEEVRVEAFAIRQSPRLRTALRAAFTIILEAIAKHPPTTEAGAANAWAMVHGRTLAGVTDPHETESFDTAARTMLDDDRIDQMADLLQEAIQLRLPAEGPRMVEIATEWVELVGGASSEGSCSHANDDAEKKHGEGSGESGDESDQADSESGDGGGKGEDAEDAEDGEDGQAADGEPGDPQESESSDSDLVDYGQEGEAEAVDNGEYESKELDDERSELGEKAVEALRELMETEWTDTNRKPEIADSRKWAERVFGKKNRSKLVKTEPTPDQRRAVVDVANFLSNLTVPTIQKSPRASQMPPGRLRSREGVRRSAERAQGMMTTAKPWKGTKRQHTKTKPVVIGIATDTSGSMRWAERSVAEFAYVYSNAGHRIGARTAAVTFCDHVNLISRPGEVMTQVVRKPANGGSEVCDYALASLDGVLRLTEPSDAAKILIVVSDGALVRDDEASKVSEWLHQMNDAGTHIIWVNREIHGDYFWLTKLSKKLPNLELVEAGGYDRLGSASDIDKAVRKALKAAQDHQIVA